MTLLVLRPRIGEEQAHTCQGRHGDAGQQFEDVALHHAHVLPPFGVDGFQHRGDPWCVHIDPDERLQP